jgi:hypothetical protein
MRSWDLTHVSAPGVLGPLSLSWGAERDWTRPSTCCLRGSSITLHSRTPVWLEPPSYPPQLGQSPPLGADHIDPIWPTPGQEEAEHKSVPRHIVSPVPRLPLDTNSKANLLHLAEAVLTLHCPTEGQSSLGAVPHIHSLPLQVPK